MVRASCGSLREERSRNTEEEGGVRRGVAGHPVQLSIMRGAVNMEGQSSDSITMKARKRTKKVTMETCKEMTSTWFMR